MNNPEWKTVPIEPTDEMVIEGVNAGLSHKDEPYFIYAAMLAAAPAAPASTVATEGEKDEQVLHKMNADLCAFYMRWEADGDYLRCRKCKRPQIASYAEKRFPHAAGCKAVGNVEQRPWLALVEFMRPLVGSAAPAAGDAHRPDFARAEQIAADFVQDYEWRGEDVAGRDTCYTPNKRESAMITNAILGLLAEPEFIAAIAQRKGDA